MARVKTCDELELAWAAGFFDGEGSVYVTLHKPSNCLHLHLQVVQSGHDLPDVILRFVKAVGGQVKSIYGPRPCSGMGTLPTWAYRPCRRAEVERVMSLLEPLLCLVKKQQWHDARAKMLAYDDELALRKKARLVNQYRSDAPRANSASSFRGVSWDSANKKWRASICIEGKVISLGRFDSERDAGHAAKNARVERIKELTSA